MCRIFQLCLIWVLFLLKCKICTYSYLYLIERAVIFQKMLG